jgi:hypothetical protein
MEAKTKMKNIFKKEYEYDFFKMVFIFDYKFILSLTLVTILATYLLPPFSQMDNPDNQTYIILVGAFAEALGLVAYFAFVRIKEGSDQDFLDYIDGVWDSVFKK